MRRKPDYMEIVSNWRFRRLQFEGDSSVGTIFSDFHFHVESAGPEHEVPVSMLRHEFGFVSILHFHFGHRFEDVRILLVVGENAVCKVRVHCHAHVALDLEDPSFLSTETSAGPVVPSSQALHNRR